MCLRSPASPHSSIIPERLSPALAIALPVAELLTALALLPQMVADWTSFSLPVGQAAPEFSLPDLDGNPVTLAMLRSPGKPVLLVFTDPHCNPCMALLPDIAQWQREQAGHATVAVISRDTPEAAWWFARRGVAWMRWRGMNRAA